MKSKFQLISKDVKIGKNVKIFNFVNLYGCEIGDNTKIGAFVEIQKGAQIGKNCKIESHTFICQGVTIEDNVFVGHNVAFINDKFPRATNKNWQAIPTLVKNGASIGTGATIMCGITIGEKALVGAGSVVIKDVPKNTIVVGNPAKVLKKFVL